MSESEETVHVNDEALYQHIEDEEWDAALSLLDQTDANERVDLISQREHSPLWTIAYHQTSLSQSARNLCLRLINIGGDVIVNQTGTMHWMDGNDGREFTVLYLACEKLNLEFIQILLDNGVNVLQELEMGKNALHIVVCNAGFIQDERNRVLEVMELLINAGGRELVLMRDNEGKTSLHYACLDTNVYSDYREQAIYLLLDSGGRELLMMGDGRDEIAFELEQGGQQLPASDQSERVLARFIIIGGREVEERLEELNNP